MAGCLVNIVLGAAEDNAEWTVCRRADTTDASTQTSKEGNELRSIVYKMIHGSTTFQLLDEYGDTFIKNYNNLMNIASKMRLDAYQHLKSKVDAEKQQKEKEQKEKEQKEKEQKEKQKEKEQKGKQQKEKEQKEKEQKEKEQKEKEQKARLKKKKERMRSLANLVKKRKTLEHSPLNTRFETMVGKFEEESVATPINVTNPFDF